MAGVGCHSGCSLCLILDVLTGGVVVGCFDCV